MDKDKKILLFLSTVVVAVAASGGFVFYLRSHEEVTPESVLRKPSISFEVFEKESFKELEVFEEASEKPEEKGRENPFDEYEIQEEEVEEEETEGDVPEAPETSS